MLLHIICTPAVYACQVFVLRATLPHILSLHCALQLLPPETSGEYAKAKEYVLERLTICKWVGVGLFFLQLLTLLLSCGLQVRGATGQETPVVVML